MRKYHKAEPKVEKQCLHCNETFFVWAGQERAAQKRGGLSGKFCSKACFLSYTQVEVSCDYCRAPFKRSRCFAGRYNGKNFCSRRCNNLGKRNPNRHFKKLRYCTKEWQEVRQQVIERDGICQICCDSLANSVHHKSWNPYDNHLENLVLLCVPCHARFKRYEEWEVGRRRIVACSELYGDIQSAVETIAPLVVN